MKYTRCGRLFLVKAFFFVFVVVVVVVFRHLKITLDSEQPMLEQKQIIGQSEEE